MGEFFTGDVSVIKNDSLDWSKELTLVKPYREEAPFEELCYDVVMGCVILIIRHIDFICIEPLDITPVLVPSLLTTSSHVHAFHKSLGDIKGFYPSFCPSCAYLEEVSREIIWSTFFDYTFGFSMAYDKFERPPTIFVTYLQVSSCFYYSEMHALDFDKLLQGELVDAPLASYNTFLVGHSLDAHGT